MTPFITLLAILKILLFRLTGHSRIVVGSPIANRNLPELERLLGFFINHLVFCTDMRGDLTFHELLQRVRETALGAYANQDVPFGKVVDALRLERDLTRTPLTQVVLLFLNPEQQGEIRCIGWKETFLSACRVDFGSGNPLWPPESTREKKRHHRPFNL